MVNDIVIDNKVKKNSYDKDYRQQNLEKIKAYQKEYYLRNKEKIKDKQRSYAVNNKDKVNRKNVRYRSRRLKKDVNFHVLHNLRNRLIKSLNGSYKPTKSLELIGCTSEFLKAHLESKFKDGMTWENYGHKGWHIDHIRPCASFNLEDPEEQKLCFNYKNLQPLWSQENFLKSDKFSFCGFG
jgi:hypothetical protein